jgi:diaminohydroxyphosphoribosylaminopyrimidine deaminase/5-amino-6-(5-phosphoribosylamino)uracil reductase
MDSIPKEITMKELYMKRALSLAGQGSGFVNPDPLSGAVVIKKGQILGEGYYKSYQSESAIIQAIKEALQVSQDNLDGAELYCNIEPNFHKEEDHAYFMKTMLNSGIAKVYFGILDPSPAKTIHYVPILRENGIETNIGILQEECEEINEIYTYYVIHKTPFVIAKWAMTLDGKLATKTGDSKWISSSESLTFVHHIRQRVSAIMVGENTVRLDDPQLTTRLKEVAVSNPLRVILSNYGDIPPTSKVLQVDACTKTIIVTSENIRRENEELFLEKGIPVYKLKERQGRIAFIDILDLLGSMGIDSLFLEGGSSVLASAFESRVVNKVYTTIAPKIVGGKEAITPVGGIGIERMRDAIELKKVSHEIIGSDVIFKGYL